MTHQEMNKSDYIHKRFAKDESIVSRKIADEFILVPIRPLASDMKSIYCLNEVGGRIWELIDGSRTVVEIRDVLIEEFDVDRGEAESDLIELLRQLESIGALKGQ